MSVSLDRFDVRLMQSGRMKGQAFIGLPSEEVAAIALRETNGYQLEGAPIIVVGFQNYIIIISYSLLLLLLFFSTLPGQQKPNLNSLAINQLSLCACVLTPRCP